MRIMSVPFLPQLAIPGEVAFLPGLRHSISAYPTSVVQFVSEQPQPTDLKLSPQRQLGPQLVQCGGYRARAGRRRLIGTTLLPLPPQPDPIVRLCSASSSICNRAAISSRDISETGR